jgi:hypothetical protein
MTTTISTDHRNDPPLGTNPVGTEDSWAQSTFSHISGYARDTANAGSEMFTRAGAILSETLQKAGTSSYFLAVGAVEKLIEQGAAAAKAAHSGAVSAVDSLATNPDKQASATERSIKVAISFLPVVGNVQQIAGARKIYAEAMQEQDADIKSNLVRKARRECLLGLLSVSTELATLGASKHAKHAVRLVSWTATAVRGTAVVAYAMRSVTGIRVPGLEQSQQALDAVFTDSSVVSQVVDYILIHNNVESAIDSRMPIKTQT